MATHFLYILEYYLSNCVVDTLNGPPTNIDANAISSTEVRLTWDPPALADRSGEDITSYIIRITDTSTGTFELQTVTAHLNQEQSYDVIISMLETFTTYSFTIRGVNTIGEGPESNGISATTFATCT